MTFFLNILSDQPNVQFYYYLSIIILRRNKKFIPSFNTTHWINTLNFLPMYTKISVIPILIFHLHIYFISSSFSCDFLLRFCFFGGGSFSFNLFMYHPPPTACNKFLRFYFKLSNLGSLTGIF